ncbi:MAG: type IX secretion system membrane protein PorP/SprF [Cyclobacteriaceae bacterium]|nr:type IX secretion system membrane protein PorP/SprF [Cyclobacteriaceae bacterium]
MKKLLVAVFCTMLPSLTAHGQQDPLYAQYLNNPFVLNPAYAGQSTVLSASLQYRTQWAQFEGNPVTATLTGHMRLLRFHDLSTISDF